MRTEGASSARASVRWLRRRPSSGCTQSGSAGPAAAAAARPPWSGAGAGGTEEEQPPRGETRGECALGGETLPLSVWPRKSSLGESSSGSVCACVRPGPWRPARPDFELARSVGPDPDSDAPRSGARPAGYAPGSRRLAHTRRVTRAVREHARAGRAPRSLPFLRQPCLRLARARGCRAWGRQRRHEVGAKTCPAERLGEDRTQKASNRGAWVAGSDPGPLGPVRTRKTNRALPYVAEISS